MQSFPENPGKKDFRVWKSPGCYQIKFAARPMPDMITKGIFVFQRKNNKQEVKMF
jgi:hypothetical protein